MGRMNKAEFAAYSLAALAVSIGGAACGRKSTERSTVTQNPTTPTQNQSTITPNPDCLSPRDKSRPYPGDLNASGDNPKYWPNAVLITTHIPPGVIGVVFSFEVPATDHWKHAKPLDPKVAGTIAQRIGPGPVEFSTQFEATPGSALCDETPESTFSQEESYAKAYADSSGAEPTGYSYDKK